MLRDVPTFKVKSLLMKHFRVTYNISLTNVIYALSALITISVLLPSSYIKPNVRNSNLCY